MQQHPFHLPLLEIPASGAQLTITDQTLWTEGIAEFHLAIEIQTPLRATVSIQKTQEGCLVEGTIEGALCIPCNRCLDPCLFPLSTHFRDVEPLPGEDEGDLVEETRIAEENGNLFLDLSGLLWEEFVLATPINPLCTPDCKGLCPQCGANRNRETCQCHEGAGDPRLVVFRSLSIPSK